MRWRWLLVLALTACGRVGFDSPGDGDDGVYTPPTCAGGCPAMEYCATAAGACGGAATCRLLPFTCPAEISFACGCDGTTYVSRCEAERVGVSIDHDGACTTTTDACPGGCGITEYCATPDGMCDGVGTCTLRPEPADLCFGSPVCGCDGNNYLSSCDAAKVGVSVLTSGACDGP